MNQKDVWDKLFNKLSLDHYESSHRFRKRKDSFGIWRADEYLSETIAIHCNDKDYVVYREKEIEHRGNAKIRRRSLKVFEVGKGIQIWGESRRVVRRFIAELRRKGSLEPTAKHL